MTKQIKLGRTDLMVNPIGLGANAVGGHNIYPDLDEQNGINVIKTAVEKGMNFIDTAYSYGMGRSEELIGQAIQETGGRSEIVLATKGAQNTIKGKRVNDNSPAFLKEAVEGSLKRLQTDYIDLFYIHQPDEDTPKYEALGALQELKEAGKIRAIGVSNFSPEQLKEANQDGYLDVFQGEYNLLNRSAEEEYFPFMREHNVSFVPYFPLVSGLLAGKYNKDTVFPEGDIRTRQAHFQGQEFKDNLMKIDEIRKIANDNNVDVVHVVLAWYLTRPEIDAIIPGAKRPDQVISNLKTLDLSLTASEISIIDNLYK